MLRKVALITGSTAGIGLGIARRLAEDGCSVIITGLGEKKQIEATVEGMRGKYHKDIHFVDADLKDEKSVHTMCDNIMGIHRKGVDILVNNAGFQHVSPIEKFPIDVWRSMIDVHLTAPFLLVRYFLPYMKEKEWGRIINMASMNGLSAQPGKIPYCTTKAGIIGMTRVIALETAEHGITCNAVCPGFVETEIAVKQIQALADKHNVTYDEGRKMFFDGIHPTKKPVTTEQISGLVSFLCTEDAANMTGGAVTMDAGHLAR